MSSIRSGAEIVVVGGGIVGASIAYFSARHGAKVTLVDADPSASATARSGGIIRMHHTNVAQARLAWKSWSVYAGWAAEIGGDCGFRRTGFALVVGPEHVGSLRRNAEMLRALGVPVWTISPREFAKLQPYCDAEGIGEVAFEPESGYAHPGRARDGFLARAAERGATIVDGTVTALVRRGDKVLGVSGTFGVLAADEVVLAANSSVPALLEPFGVAIPVVRRYVHAYHLRWEWPGDVPVFTTMDDTIGTYYKPVAGGLMLGAGTRAEDVRAESEREQRQHKLAFVRSAERRIPSLRAAEVVETAVAAEYYTPDKHGVVGRIAPLENVYAAFAFSGGGFKIAPAIGMAVAEELLSSTASRDLAPFRSTRFETGDLVRATHPYAHA